MTVPATLIASIINGDYDDDLDRIIEAVKSRRRENSERRGRINALTLKPGTRVRLKGLSPKYLNGLEGEIITDPLGGSGKKHRIAVKLDHPARRYGSIVRPPGNCMEAI